MVDRSTVSGANAPEIGSDMERARRSIHVQDPAPSGSYKVLFGKDEYLPSRGSKISVARWGAQEALVALGETL